MRPSRIGLTGGIASGKSTVTALLRQWGFPVADADEIYHGLLRDDAEMVQEIRDRFGSDVFTPEGALDRARLGAQVFSDPKGLQDLGHIAHPRVRREILRFFEHPHPPGPLPLAFACIPLLFENGLDSLFVATILVDLPEAVQLERLMQRQGISAEDAQLRMDAQMPLAEKRARADFTIDNSGPLEGLGPRLEALLGQVAEQVQGPGDAP